MDFCSASDFDYEVYRLAYRGTSFVPEERAKNEISRNVAWLNGAAAELEDMCKNDEQRTFLEGSLKTFKEGFIARSNAWAVSRSRCVSTMVSGRANFNVRRAEKANASEHRRAIEFSEWQEKELRRIKKGLLARKAPEQVAQEKIEGVKRMIAESSFDSALFKSNLYGRLATFARNTTDTTVQEVLAFLKEFQGKYHPDQGFTPRHKVWKLKGVPEEPQGQEEETRETINGVEVVRNPEIDRVQIFFIDKPDSEMRDKLKGAGWRWSPRYGAWQRKNTDNAIRSAKMLLA